MSFPTQLPRDFQPHSVLEPIHGLIRLTEPEFGILDHPLFRRLRRIKQNGLLYLVFPSATHNRFEHSLGALHVADAMLEQIWLNSVVARRKRAVVRYNEGRSNAAIDIATAPEEELRWVVRVTRLAALVHDLGHGPLSHTFDSFALFRDDLNTLLAGGAVPALQHVAHSLVEWDRGGAPGSPKYDRVPHEVMSCVFFAHIWDSVKNRSSVLEELGESAKALPLAVAAAILGIPDIAAGLPNEYQQWLPFIHDVVASAPADADRMDYLERDSRSLGVTYGLFDRNRVMKSLLCFRKTEGERSVLRLGIKRSGIPAIENLVQARFELYVQVYFHKTNEATSQMLAEIARRASKEQVRLFPVDRQDVAGSFARLEGRYSELGDDHFVRILRGLDPSYPRLPDEAIALANAVDSRQLWKRLYEGEEEGAQWVAEQLKNAESSSQAVVDGIRAFVSKPKATKDLDEGATLLVRGEDGIYAPQTEHSWYKSSIVVRALAKAEGNIGRVYARGAALESETYDRLRKEARRLGREYEIGREVQRKHQEEIEKQVRREVIARLSREQNATTKG